MSQKSRLRLQSEIVQLFSADLRRFKAKKRTQTVCIWKVLIRHFMENESCCCCCFGSQKAGLNCIFWCVFNKPQTHQHTLPDITLRNQTLSGVESLISLLTDMHALCFLHPNTQKNCFFQNCFPPCFSFLTAHTFTQTETS